MATRAKNRPKRTPIHQRKRFQFKTEEGYRYYVVPELPGEVEAAKEAGYEFVLDKSANEGVDNDSSDQGAVQRVVLNKDPNAAYHTGVLMRMPQEWFDEDRADAQAIRDEELKQLDPRNAQSGYVDGHLNITKGE